MIIKHNFSILRFEFSVSGTDNSELKLNMHYKEDDQPLKNKVFDLVILQ